MNEPETTGRFSGNPSRRLFLTGGAGSLLLPNDSNAAHRQNSFRLRELGVYPTSVSMNRIGANRNVSQLCRGAMSRTLTNEWGTVLKNDKYDHHLANYQNEPFSARFAHGAPPQVRTLFNGGNKIVLTRFIKKGVQTQYVGFADIGNGKSITFAFAIGKNGWYDRPGQWAKGKTPRRRDVKSVIDGIFYQNFYSKTCGSHPTSKLIQDGGTPGADITDTRARVAGKIAFHGSTKGVNGLLSDGCIRIPPADMRLLRQYGCFDPGMNYDSVDIYI